jgi:hypothetical protein
MALGARSTCSSCQGTGTINAGQSWYCCHQCANLRCPKCGGDGLNRGSQAIDLH